jgi:hypothetical protein
MKFSGQLKRPDQLVSDIVPIEASGNHHLVLNKDRSTGSIMMSGHVELFTTLNDEPVVVLNLMQGANQYELSVNLEYRLRLVSSDPDEKIDFMVCD